MAVLKSLSDISNILFISVVVPVDSFFSHSGSDFPGSWFDE